MHCNVGLYTATTPTDVVHVFEEGVPRVIDTSPLNAGPSLLTDTARESSTKHAISIANCICVGV